MGDNQSNRKLKAYSNVIKSQQQGIGKSTNRSQKESNTNFENLSKTEDRYREEQKGQ